MSPVWSCRSRLSPHREYSENQTGRIGQTKAVGLTTGMPHGYVRRPAAGEGDDGVEICQNRGFPLNGDPAAEPVDGKQRLAPGREAPGMQDWGVVSIGARARRTPRMIIASAKCT
jgi:hypothetical protein